VPDLHSFDRRDLLAGLEELRLRMARLKDEHVVEAVRLS
jgi:hypothetical protein